jgi:hypothetical protein
VQRNSRTAICAATVVFATLVSCGRVPRLQQEDLVRGHWAAPTNCPAHRHDALPPADSLAVRCAEAFITRNGYTDNPAVTDTTQLAFESIEVAATLADLRAGRRGMLEPQAYGICRDVGRYAFIVVFRYAPRAFGRTVPLDRTTTGRAVTMDSALTGLRVQHQDFNLAAVEVPYVGCRRVDQSWLASRFCVPRRKTVSTSHMCGATLPPRRRGGQPLHTN